MNKKGQSILDFINFFPLQSVNVHRAPITNKEAQTLFDIWESSSTDKWGNVTVPQKTDTNVVATLINKGYLTRGKNVLGTYHAVGITRKGKDIIRNIILLTEDSTFDKSSSYKSVNYDGIHRSLYEKTAQINDFAEVDVRRLDGYLNELAHQVNKALQLLSSIKLEETNRKQRFTLSEVVTRIEPQLNRIYEYGQYVHNVLDIGKGM